MHSTMRIAALALALGAFACASDQQFLANMQGKAIQVATARGQFELNCQNVNATVLSSEVVQPAFQGPVVAGIQRAEYTIGVAGCNERKTFVVVCPEGGDGCFAAGPGNFMGGAPQQF